jgi:hypothetical protein
VTRARRHHVVSNFYLKGFANDDALIAQVALPDPTPVLVSTTNATVVKDFYTIELPDGTASDFMELAFSEIEGAASAALASVLDGKWPLVGQDRGDLAAWLALQYLRGVGVRDGQTQMRAQMIRMVVGVSGKEALRQHIERAEGVPLSDEDLDAEWDDLTQPSGPTLEPDPSFHMQLLDSEWPGTTRVLMHAQWSLVRFERRALATSDHPVSLYAHRDHPPFFGVGIVTSAGMVAPLSHRVGLVTSHELAGQQDLVLPASTVMAKSFNGQVVGNSRRFVYHHPDDAPLAGLDLPPRREAEYEPTPDHFIRPEGFFAGLTDEQRAAQGRIARATSEGDDSGFSLNDLEWPIEGRREVRQPARDPRAN